MIPPSGPPALPGDLQKECRPWGQRLRPRRRDKGRDQRRLGRREVETGSRKDREKERERKREKGGSGEGRKRQRQGSR